LLAAAVIRCSSAHNHILPPAALSVSRRGLRCPADAADTLQAAGNDDCALSPKAGPAAPRCKNSASDRARRTAADVRNVLRTGAQNQLRIILESCDESRGYKVGAAGFEPAARRPFDHQRPEADRRTATHSNTRTSPRRK